jgi:hypothetical protein
LISDCFRLEIISHLTPASFNFPKKSSLLKSLFSSTLSIPPLKRGLGGFSFFISFLIREEEVFSSEFSQKISQISFISNSSLFSSCSSISL